MSYDSPFKMRVWHNNQMQMVQTLCHNQGGAMWYASGNQFGWGWVNPDYDGWTVDNPKPSPADVSPVMRWTGLKDKNGVDIWEGDIVQYEVVGTILKGIVSWGDYDDGEYVKSLECWIVGYVPLSCFVQYADKHGVIVIGDLWGNPELLLP